MNKLLRTVALGGFAAFVAAVGFAAPSNAQQLAIGSTTQAHLFPTAIPFVPGTVPADCLAYSLRPGTRPIVFCENIAGRPLLAGVPQVNTTLLFGGYKPWGTRVPDDCVLRRGAITGRSLLYCKTVHW